MTQKKIQPLKKDEKLKILFLAANPAYTPILKIEEESRAIQRRIWAAQNRNNFTMVSAWAVRPNDLLQTFMEHKPHIVHFSGHGDKDGELLFLDKNGDPKPVSNDAIQSLFETLQDNIRLAFFNACHTKEQAQAVVSHIDFAIGMNKAITDEAARVFSASFYGALGYGRNIQNAFDQGLVALKLEGISEDQIPELHSKKGLNPANYCLIEPLIETLPMGDRSPFDRGLEHLELQDYGEALQYFTQAKRAAPEDIKTNFYYCLAFLTERPMLGREKSNMDVIVLILNEIVRGVDPWYASLSRILLGIIHYDFYIKKNEKPRGLTSAEIFRYLGHNPPGFKEKDLVSHISYSENAATMCGLT